MTLYGLLSNRIAINVLKTVYMHEVREKASHTTSLHVIKKRLPIEVGIDDLNLLVECELVTMDLVEGEHILSITQKGKEFIEVFDQLIEVYEGKEKSPAKSVKVKYELTSQEKRILVLTYKMLKESGAEYIPLKNLVEEMYPREDYSTKISSVSRYVSRLEDIYLMQRKKEGRKSLVRVTDKGFRIIKEQYLKGLMV